MVQDEDLKILGSVAASEQREQLDGAAQREVGEFGQHQRRPPRGRQMAQRRAVVWREPAAQRPRPTLRTLHPMVDLHGHARDAAWMPPPHGGPALDLSSAGTRPAIGSPAGANPDRAAGHREPTLGRPAHPRGVAGPGCQVSASSIARVSARQRPPAGSDPSRRWHPLIRPSRNCTGAGVVRAWSARPGCHWTTTGRIRRFLGQAVTDGLLLWRGRRLRGAPSALVVDPGLRPRFFSVFPTPANFRSR
jgi:hypothetical protein